MSIYDGIQILFAILFIALSLARTLALRRKQIEVWVMGKEREGGGKPGLEVLFVTGIVLYYVLIFLFATGHGNLLPGIVSRPWFDSPTLKTAAVGIVAVAFALNVLGLAALGESWRVGVDAENPGRLVTGGIYRYSRNPIMVCLFLYALGLWLTYSNLLMLLSLVVVIVGVPYQVAQEEAFLRRQHGERYLDYQARVGRYWTMPVPRRQQRGAGA